MAKPAHHLIQAVIWDLGGVLARTNDRRPRSELARRLGISYEELDDVVFHSSSALQASLGEISTGQHWANVYQTLDWPLEHQQEFQDLFWGGDSIDQQLVATIRGLKPAYKTGLLSNNWPNLRRLIKDRWKIGDAFDDLVISAEVGLMKPDPRIYQLAMERLDVQPAQAIFVDDFPENIQAAQQAGWHTILFQNPDQARSDLNSLLGIPIA